MKVTVRDIARAAGVSPGTVSNALNNRAGSISSAKREEILKVAQQLGYFKKAKRTGILRLLIFRSNLRIVGDSIFFSELIESIEASAREAGYILTINYIKDIKKEVLGRLDDPSSSDGLIILGTEMDFSSVKACHSIRIPYLIMDNAFIDRKTDFVAINNRDAMYEMTRELIDRGHEKIGLINCSSQINNFKERKLGYLQALSDCNLHYYPEFEILADPQTQQAEKDIQIFLELMQQEGMELPTAYMAVNDDIALGAGAAFDQMGLQIALTGFDDLPGSRLVHPPLSTIHVDRTYLGREAVKMLLDKFENSYRPSNKVLVGTDILVRDSIWENTRS